MAKYVVLDTFGLPILLAEGAGDPPPGSLVLAESVSLDQISRQVLVDGLWQARPQPVLSTAPGTPMSLHLVTAPEGAVVRISDLDAGDILFEGPASEGAVWVFPDPGRYAAEVSPPPPWLPAELQFEVTE